MFESFVTHLYILPSSQSNIVPFFTNDMEWHIWKLSIMYYITTAVLFARILHACFTQKANAQSRNFMIHNIFYVGKMLQAKEITLRLFISTNTNIV